MLAVNILNGYALTAAIAQNFIRQAAQALHGRNGANGNPIEVPNNGVVPGPAVQRSHVNHPKRKQAKIARRK